MRKCKGENRIDKDQEKNIFVPYNAGMGDYVLSHC